MPRKQKSKFQVTGRGVGVDSILQDRVETRKELLGALYNLLQGSVSAKVSGSAFGGYLSSTEGFLFELDRYATSLKDAVTAITLDYASGAENSCDADLAKVSELCDALIAGVGMVRQYLHPIKAFTSDLEGIKSEIHNCLINIHREL